MRKAANIPGFEGTKTMVALCYIITVSSVSVQFASSSLPILSLVFSISPPFFRSLKAVSFFFCSLSSLPSLFLFFFLFSSSLPLFSFFLLSFSSASLFSVRLSSGFYSQKMHALR
jgi:hypothetical protein